jgi:hypothetical protein
MTTPIQLTWHEAAMASEVGRLRQLVSVKAGRLDQHGFAGDGWSEHIEGACGEQAVAKALNVYWDGSIDSFKRDDLPGLQVRTRSRHDWDLIVRPNDPDQAVFVLVTGRCPSYLVQGWIRGCDAKRPDWLKNHGGRPAAYFVPRTALHQLSELVHITPNTQAEP